ncbi:MAG: hypothetical protein AB1428_07725 [Bacteroidota bacterium]
MEIPLLGNGVNQSFILPRVVNWLGRRSVSMIVIVSAVLIALITMAIPMLKGATGILGSVAPFYLLPIGLVALRSNRAAGLLTAILCSLVWALLDVRFAGKVNWWPETWNILMRAGIFVAFALVLSRIRYDILKEIQLNTELQAALAEVKQLSGLLPICAWCKRIRDDGGNWEPIETYISVHSDADFTHGICPDCAKKYHHTQ